MTKLGPVSKLTKGHGGSFFDATFSEYSGIPINQMDMKQPLQKKK